MKDCEYYERLISDSLDTALESDVRRELDAHLEKCSSCREFKSDLMKGAHVLKMLPVMKNEKPSPRVALHRKVRKAWMGSRVSVPLPLAVLILLVLVGWGTIGWLHPVAPPDQKVYGSRTITNIQIERLKPAQPVVLSSAETQTKGR